MSLAGPGLISLLVSDVDGTLVTRDKQLTPRTVEAIGALGRAGIGFTVVSSRPPRGLSLLFDRFRPLLPFGGFNGGSIVDPADGTVLEETLLPPAATRRALDVFDAAGVGAWVFGGGEWLIRDPAGPHVEHERSTIGFEPRVVAGFADAMLERVGKLVGVSGDHARLASCEAEVRTLLGGGVSALRSQPYYLDITHPDATKGRFVRSLSRRLSIPLAEIAVIGDADNDVFMFEEAGFSIAMGNATDAVKARADAVTVSNAEDGFADAVARLVLPRGPTRALADAR